MRPISRAAYRSEMEAFIGANLALPRESVIFRRMKRNGRRRVFDLIFDPRKSNHDLR